MDIYKFLTQIKRLLVLKKLLNTFYITKQGSYLRKEGDTIVVEFEGNVAMRIPLHNLSSIIAFGNVMVSPFLLGACAEKGICVSMLTEYGKFLARVEGPVSGNVFLRVAQIRAYENKEKKADIAKSFVIGKIYNTKMVLQRRIRDHGETRNIIVAEEKQKDVLHKLKYVPSEVERIRSLEGEAAAAYFSAFSDMIVAQKNDFYLTSRQRRPPMDPMNALLSFLYTLLAHECVAALESVGLDPQIGFLHELRPGRPALALDLMEEFRAIIADRIALNLVNLRQITSSGFTITESGAVLMKDDTRKKLLTVWQEKKQEEITHPFLEEKIQIGLLPYAQALLLSRYLRGDFDAYPPYLTR